VRNVSRYFRRREGEPGVSFSVEPGIVLGLIGPNGAGKTTLFQLHHRFYPPSKGEILFDGSASTGFRRTRSASWDGADLAESPAAGEADRAGERGGRRALPHRLRLPGEGHRPGAAPGGGAGKAGEVLAGGLPIGERKKLELARVLATKRA